MKTVSIFGSTGSIGVQTLEVIREHKDQFAVHALVAGKSDEKLIAQAREFRPKIVGIVDEQRAKNVRNALPGTRLVSGPDAAKLAAQDEVDIAVCAIVGMAGLDSFVESMQHAKKVCLANKESLVCAGELVEDYSKILPVDSEHSAIFQCLLGEDRQNIGRLILTASGGPFRDLSIEKFPFITVEDALRHPNWKMGKKITIDSATMMNKGLEIIEAVRLFEVAPERVDVVVHQESVVHSIVEFIDGSVKAQMGQADMKVPIQYALSYPGRIENSLSKKLDLTALGCLHFEQPNFNRFPCLKIAYEALRMGGTAPTAMNAANEAAVALFLNKKIQFIDIPRVVEFGLHNHQERPLSLENIHKTYQDTLEDVLKNFGRILN